MSPEKTDYPPLLQGGFHPFSLLELHQLTVSEFPNSQRRPQLFSSLEIYLELLEATGLKADVWVDGSFMCSKEEPDDIDLVVCFDPDSARSLSADAQQQARTLLDTHFVSSRFNLHLFRIMNNDPEALAYWSKLFGTMRDERTPKGMALLRVNP